MDIFHVFKIVQMIPNSEKHHMFLLASSKEYVFYDIPIAVTYLKLFLKRSFAHLCSNSGK